MDKDIDLSTLQMLSLSNAAAVEALANIMIRKGICTKDELQSEALAVKKRMGKEKI